jgi:hypothetical protein
VHEGHGVNRLELALGPFTWSGSPNSGNSIIVVGFFFGTAGAAPGAETPPEAAIAIDCPHFGQGTVLPLN